MLLKSRRAQRRALLLAALCAAAVGLVPAAAEASGSNISLPKVMTRNLYLGADLTPATDAIQHCPYAPDPVACGGYLAYVNSQIWNRVVATNFPARAKLLAKEIDDNDPYIVGLQEVALWRSGPYNGLKDAGPADAGPKPRGSGGTIEYDFLASLLSELAALGTHYTPMVIQNEADIESPALAPPTYTSPIDRRLTMRDVILVRTDLPSSIVKFTNPQSGNYNSVVTVPTGTPAYGGDIVFKRGWTSVDVKILGHPAAKFVNTHLESAVSYFRSAQAGELVAGPLNTSLPVILVGDLNSDPDIAPTGPFDGTSDWGAYRTIAAAGLVETGNTAKTFGHQADLLDLPGAIPFTERIDHIMTRPSTFGLLTNKLVGNDAANRTPGGLWPSDHGGLVAGFGS